MGIRGKWGMESVVAREIALLTRELDFDPPKPKSRKPSRKGK